MGFYIRKSFGFGPLRLNLSRSGLGASFGVKGARIGIGPRGTYVHAGRGGLYYRKTLSAPGTGGSRGAQPLGQPGQGGPQPAAQAVPIESADVSKLVDSSSVELLEELNRVQQRISIAGQVLWVVLLTLGVLAFTGAPEGAYLALALVSVVALPYARHLDVTRGTALLEYDLEPGVATAFETLTARFRDLQACDKVWHVEAARAAVDAKRNAGAGRLVKKNVILPRLSHPRRVICNLEIPSLPAGRQTLYFFPDRVLVYEKKGVGAVSYRDLQVEAETVRFIEEDAVPKDARVVDRTWKYVNKKGGPDRRFRDSRELPVVLYGQLHFSSSSGLNEQFQTSKPEAAQALATAIDGVRLVC